MSLPSPELPQPGLLREPEFVDPLTGPMAPVPLPSKDENHLSEIAVGIAAGFIAMRALVSGRLVSQAAPSSEGATRELLERAWIYVRPSWAAMVLPAITRAYELGAVNGAALTLSERQALATDYAITLGDAIHETSAQALLEGYYGQLRSNFNERLAWERAATGYGLDRTQFRSWIAAIANEPRTFVGTTFSMASRAAMDKFLMARAERIGRTEAYHATQVGKSVFWLMAQAQGDLPMDAQKKWVTARDERVCPICGPLDDSVVALAERFEVNGTSLWAPGAHPNCRCELELVYDSTVIIPDDASELLGDYVMAKRIAKADYGRRPDGGRYWNVRDEDGEFAPRSERAKPKRRLEVLDREEAEEIIEATQEVKDPFASEKTDIFADAKIDIFSDAKADLFAEAKNDLFADAKVDIFADASTDIFADSKTDVFATTKKKLRRIIFIDGRMQVVDEEVDAEPSDWHPERAYMFGSSFLEQYMQAQMRQAQETGEKVRYPVYPGAIIDMDFDAVNGADIPMGRPALLEDPSNPDGTIEEILLDEAADYVSFMNRTMRQSAYHSSYAADERASMIFEELAYDTDTFLEDTIGERSIEDLINTAVRNGGDYPFDQGYGYGLGYQKNIDFIKQKLLDKDGAYERAVEDLMWQYAFEFARDSYALNEIDSTIGDAEYPTLFKFEGFRGAFVDSKFAALGYEAFVEGQYEVKKSELRDTGDFIGAVLNNRGDETFKKFRLITLVPKRLYDDTEA